MRNFLVSLVFINIVDRRRPGDRNGASFEESTKKQTQSNRSWSFRLGVRKVGCDRGDALSLIKCAG